MMNRKQMRRLSAEKAKGRFTDGNTIVGDYIPRHPESAEREYKRVANAYVHILKDEMERSLPELKAAYKPNRDENVREDSVTDFFIAINKLFDKIRDRLTDRLSEFGLRHRLETIASMTRKLSIKEWKHAVKSALGIDILDDYYLGATYNEYLRAWVERNVGLVSTIPQDTLGEMRKIVYDGFMKGKTTTDMVKELQKAYRITRRHAELIARDQTAKLNGQIQRAQQTDAGITEYVWCTVGDERVRRSHRELHGRRCKWDEPPENSDGRACHPGEDFQCRCIARPVFDSRTLALPVAVQAKQQQQQQPQPQVRTTVREIKRRRRAS